MNNPGYTYLSTEDSAVNVGLVSNVALEDGEDHTIRQVNYVYYDGTQPYGNAGDLMTATVSDGSSNMIDTNYYRYYTPGSNLTDEFGNTIGYVGGLKYMFGTESYTLLTTAAGTDDLSSISDAEAAQYANINLQYDSDQRVTQLISQGSGCSVCDGGLGTYTYRYDTNHSVEGDDSYSYSDGLNTWKYKTTETLPDGSANIVYANYLGETLLSIHIENITDPTSPAWGTLDVYYDWSSEGASASLIGRLHYEGGPSAVTLVSEDDTVVVTQTYGGLPGSFKSTGLINVTDYYTTTSASDIESATLNLGDDSGDSGGVAGYVKDYGVKDGSDGTFILTESFQYYLDTPVVSAPPSTSSFSPREASC